MRCHVGLLAWNVWDLALGLIIKHFTLKHLILKQLIFQRNPAVPVLCKHHSVLWQRHHDIITIIEMILSRLIRSQSREHRLLLVIGVLGTLPSPMARLAAFAACRVCDPLRKAAPFEGSRHHRSIGGSSITLAFLASIAAFALEAHARFQRPESSCSCLLLQTISGFLIRSKTGSQFWAVLTSHQNLLFEVLDKVSILVTFLQQGLVDELFIRFLLHCHIGRTLLHLFGLVDVIGLGPVAVSSRPLKLLEESRSQQLHASSRIFIS